MKKFLLILNIFISIICFSEDLSIAGKDFQNWSSIDLMPGDVKVVSDYAEITEKNPEGAYGGVKSEKIKVNFDKNPLVIVNIKSLDASWGMKIKTKDGEKWGYYIQGDTSENGEKTIEVVKALKMYNPNLKLQGEQEIELWIITVGKEGGKVNVSSLDIIEE